MKSRFIKTAGASVACMAVVASALAAVPATAATTTQPSATETGEHALNAAVVLADIRADLLTSGAAGDVAAFDHLTPDQRDELASYFLDASVASEVVSGSRSHLLGLTTVQTNGDFEWGATDAGASPADHNGDPLTTRAASRTSSGTQWFAFAGIRLSETKVSETYEYSGTTARKLLGYSCTVVRNIQPFTEVKSSKSSGYISGGQATAKCKVVVRRGVPTPWGAIAWSTSSSIQRLSARGNGAVTYNGWA